MAEQDDKLTPAMKQFSRFKAKYPDCILFFRMGDFYETFYEDAKICSRVCGLTLTSRSKGENPVPLAGVPYHAVEGYLKKMLQAGFKVAVCEQVENPKLAKGSGKARRRANRYTGDVDGRYSARGEKGKFSLRGKSRRKARCGHKLGGYFDGAFFRAESAGR